MATLDRGEIKKLNRFFRKNLRHYPPRIQDFFKNEFNPEIGYVEDFINQIYTYLFPNSYDNLFYHIFAEYLMDRYPSLSERKIVEVAGGFIPGLSIYLIKKYGVSNPITCYDPTSIPLKIPGIITKNEAFTETTDVSGSDLLVAHCPCEALEDIVKNTIKSRIEMCVQTCPCGHEYSSYRYFMYYINSLVDSLKALEDDGFKVECFETESFDFTHAPVISVRRREKINK